MRFRSRIYLFTPKEIMKISSYVMVLLGSAGRRCGSCWWRVGWSSVYGAAVQADWLTELLWVWAERLKLLTLTVGFPLHSGDRWARPWSVNYCPSCWRPSTASLCASPSAALPLIPTSPPLKKKKDFSVWLSGPISVNHLPSAFPCGFLCVCTCIVIKKSI